jgi:hypothetical protein
MPSRTFHVHSDPGHAWVKVPKSFLLQIIGDNWRDTFTPFSYERGDYVYLEEDDDAARFVHWCRASGIEPVFKPARTGASSRYSRIRTYLPLQPA